MTAAAAQRIGPGGLAERIAAAAQAAGRFLLCTDFDGSLAPIRSRPERVHALAAASHALTQLSRAGASQPPPGRVAVRVAVISARDALDVAARVNLGPEAIVYGNYGLERLARGRRRIASQALRWLPAIRAATRDLQAALDAGGCAGAALESKACGVVLHLRGVRRRTADQEGTELAGEVAARHGLAAVTGKRTVELRPPLRVDKGSTVAVLRRGAWREAAVCVAGDDCGDLPMLRLARRASVPAVSVAIGDDESPPELYATAEWRIDGPRAWAQTLTALVENLAG